MKKLLLFIGFALVIYTGYSQTPISGMINSDTVLRKSNSPYLVSSNLVIFPKGKVTIEPGVEIRFSNGVSLEVRGTLIALGTKSDSITFTAVSPTQVNIGSTTDSSYTVLTGSWNGISIKNTQGGNAGFNYCKFLYASVAINEECCWGGKDAVKNSRFTSNATAIGGYTGNIMTVDSCLFTNNTYCLTQADKTVNHCKFTGNAYGLYQTERISVYNSEFTNNTQVALNGGRGILSGCTIENNKIGVQSFFEGFTIKNCTISNNDVGIELTDYDGSIAPIDSSHICNNKTFNVKNYSRYNVSLYGNCWCTSDSATIENKIYDGTDSKNFGFISYEIFNGECDSVIKKVNKTIAKTNKWILANSPYILTENFIVDTNDTLFIEPGVEARFSNGTSLLVRGTLIARGTKSDSITFTAVSPIPVNISSATDSSYTVLTGSWNGIDIKNTQGGNANFNYCKFLYASTAINEECCFGGKDAVKNSRFTSNGTAIGGYTGNIMTVDSCLFTNNTYCLTQADKIVNHCKFSGNAYGLFQTERVSVYNSEFTNNTQAALNGGRGTLSGCTIENNKVGVQAFFQGFTIKNCTISNNDIGIELADYDGSIAPIDSSHICNNKTFNVKNYSRYNVSLYGNCWCTSDSATIENKIFDGTDNPNLGFISYEIFDGDCNSVIKKVDKTISRSNKWVLARSPYILTENYIVNTNDTLFIEPGVEARFANGVSLEVRGTLLAIGTKSDSITFTAVSPTQVNIGSTSDSSYTVLSVSWNGIDIKNTQGGNASFKYCKFLYASVAINEECCWGGIDAVKNSRFTSNGIAIAGYTGNIMTVDSSLFTNNANCLTQADKSVNHSKFSGNAYGLYQTERISVYNSEFTNNTQAALNGGRGILSGCTIENNKIGVQSFFEGFTIKNCTISNNDIGIELGDYDGSIAPIDSSHICNNKTYNVKNNSSHNAALYGNCWCSSDSATVENKIFDGWDNSAYGLVDYTLYSENCLKPIFKTLKLKHEVIYFTSVPNIKTESNLNIYPNPVSETLTLDHANNLKKIIMVDDMGRILYNNTYINQDVIKINTSRYTNGLYILKTYNKDSSVNTYRITVIKK